MSNDIKYYYDVINTKWWYYDVLSGEWRECEEEEKEEGGATEVGDGEGTGGESGKQNYETNNTHNEGKESMEWGGASYVEYEKECDNGYVSEVCRKNEEKKHPCKNKDEWVKIEDTDNVFTNIPKSSNREIKGKESTSNSSFFPKLSKNDAAENFGNVPTKDKNNNLYTFKNSMTNYKHEDNTEYSEARRNPYEQGGIAYGVEKGEGAMYRNENEGVYDENGIYYYNGGRYHDDNGIYYDENGVCYDYRGVYYDYCGTYCDKNGTYEDNDKHYYEHDGEHNNGETKLVDNSQQRTGIDAYENLARNYYYCYGEDEHEQKALTEHSQEKQTAIRSIACVGWDKHAANNTPEEFQEHVGQKNNNSNKVESHDGGHCGDQENRDGCVGYEDCDGCCGYNGCDGCCGYDDCDGCCDYENCDACYDYENCDACDGYENCDACDGYENCDACDVYENSNACDDYLDCCTGNGAGVEEFPPGREKSHGEEAPANGEEIKRKDSIDSCSVSSGESNRLSERINSLLNHSSSNLSLSKKDSSTILENLLSRSFTKSDHLNSINTMERESIDGRETKAGIGGKGNKVNFREGDEIECNRKNVRDKEGKEKSSEENSESLDNDNETTYVPFVRRATRTLTFKGQGGLAGCLKVFQEKKKELMSSPSNELNDMEIKIANLKRRARELAKRYKTKNQSTAVQEKEGQEKIKFEDIVLQVQKQKKQLQEKENGENRKSPS
ncbi:conserved Plasmodium protein, unknown function [Plasmodium ovale]|uniref:Uncharacterized protein n=1 Tax=Plasmodium ovale TaxID=36330 RepID=A0A1D3U9U6_PLAOA|nr:conserved Plasmodium protein, unknown function [Plasmodium ovale]